MGKKRGLGRGLDALLGGADHSEKESSKDKEKAGQSSRDGLTTVSIDQINRGAYQPRNHFDEESLRELADSISRQGVVQPVVLRPNSKGYELIAGERRWRAAQLAGLHEIPAVIKQYSDADAAAVSLIENIQREDLNPLEEASALQRLQLEFDMTHQAVAKAIGRSRAAVSNLLRLLDLHDDVKNLVNSGQLEMGHARTLLGADTADQPALAKQIVTKQLSVRATEALIKSYKTGKSAKKSKTVKVPVDPDIQALELRLSDTLGSSVGIKHKPGGGGKLEISYSSLDELEGILSHIH